ncbi:MAG: hypothetical protein QF535_18865, partial [Anaerolineales bacterium]|nr:hypothetical protein [Anaerolineales bacterium]
KHIWRVLFLSTGEISLADHLGSVGKKTKAGQEVRLVDIPMDTGVYGGFEEIHGFTDGSEFSKYLAEDRIYKYYGVVFRAYLEKVACAKSEIETAIKRARKDFTRDVLPPDASGQVKRVADKFGLVAAAGSLATQMGLTGWDTTEPIEAAKKCFDAWLQARGGAGNQEDQQAIEQVVSFIEAHGESRFSDWDSQGKTINRVGFKRQESGQTHYYIFSNSFRNEICKGLSSSRVAELCIKKGLLKADIQGNPSHSRALPDSIKKQRVYIFIQGGSDD